MARKPNYDFEKRRKEQERKAKKEEKARRKTERTGDVEYGVDEFGNPVEIERGTDELPPDEGDDEAAADGAAQ